MAITLNGTTGITTPDVDSTDLTATGNFTSRGIDDNATSTAMTLDTSGRVGIGTSSISTPLHVVGAGDLIRAGADSQQISIGVNTGGGENYIYGSNHPIKFGINGTERMRIDSSGHAIIPAGVTLGTSAGVYNAANTLDDYEEGTWTPVFNNVTTPTYTVQTGTYTKIGRIVHVSIIIEYSGLDTNDSSSLSVSLPFAASAPGVFHIAESGSSTGFIGSNTISLIGSTGAGASTFAVGSTGDYNDGDYDSGNFNSSGALRFYGSYPAS